MTPSENRARWVLPIPEVLPVDEPAPTNGPPPDEPLPEASSLEVAPVEPLPEVIELLPEVEEPLAEEALEVVMVDEPLEFAIPVDPTAPVSPRGNLGWPILAWMWIGALVFLEFSANHIWPHIEPTVKRMLAEFAPQSSPEGSPPHAAGNGMEVNGAGEQGGPNGNADDGFDFALMQMQSRYLVGWNSLFRNASFYGQARAMNTGSADQRLRAIVLAGEMASPTEAIEELDRLETLVHLDPLQGELRGTLRSLYQDYDRGNYSAPSLEVADRQLLKEELGWFGELALAPRQGPDQQAREAAIRPARRTALTIVGAFGALALLGLIGLCFLIIFAIYLLAGWLRRGFGRHGPYAGIYAETFALWMIAFLGFNLGAHVFLDDLKTRLLEQAKSTAAGPELEGYFRLLYEWRLVLLGLVELATLLVVFWPLVRGVPWRELKHDLGLNWGRRPWAEPFIGLGCYVMSLPLLGIGFLITIILMLLLGRVPGLGGAELLGAEEQFKSHPIVEVVARGDWSVKLQVFFLASIVAPIVEEIMFRGVLYRHLRDVTGKFGFVLSLFVSGTVTSFIFAVIHPQDMLAFPALMSLAYGFTLAREWRGSVVPGMVMHGLHNGLIMTLLIVILSL